MKRAIKSSPIKSTQCKRRGSKSKEIRGARMGSVELCEKKKKGEKKHSKRGAKKETKTKKKEL
jgi:hypothetical protein